MKSRPSVEKRRKELARLERNREKEERRKARRIERSNLPSVDMPPTVDLTQGDADLK